VSSEFALGIGSKRYVKRFLDAITATFLFAKGVIAVEGIAEQFVLLYLADYLDRAVEDLHTTVASVGGSIFGHLLTKLKDSLSSCEKCWLFKIAKNISIGNALDESRRQKVVALANAYVGRPLVIRWLPPCYSSFASSKRINCGSPRICHTTLSALSNQLLLVLVCLEGEAMVGFHGHV